MAVINVRTQRSVHIALLISIVRSYILVPVFSSLHSYVPVLLLKLVAKVPDSAASPAPVRAPAAAQPTPGRPRSALFEASSGQRAAPVAGVRSGGAVHLHPKWRRWAQRCWTAPLVSRFGALRIFCEFRAAAPPALMIIFQQTLVYSQGNRQVSPTEALSGRCNL